MANTDKKRELGGKRARCAEYLIRATCYTCKVVFFSPTKRNRHARDHKNMTGANHRRVAKGA